MWRARHYGDIAGRIAEARETLRLAHRYYESFEDLARSLCVVHLTDDEFARFLADVFPPNPDGSTTKATEQYRTLARTVYETSPDLKMWRGTAWAAYNAAVAVNDHAMQTKHVDRTLERVWFDVSGVKSRAEQSLRRIVADR
jgi:hypothetical protein